MSAGVRFGNYELRALLGVGGMARVYRAVRVGPMGFSKEVALKVLDPSATATEGQIASLTDEARLGGLLRHPNIVATDELGQVGAHYYIAMELVEGWPLDALLAEHRRRRTAVPRAVVLEILARLCDALSYAHALHSRDGRPLGLVHRDMKPGNVMIGREGAVKILDFGIAKAATNLYATQAQSTRGTPLFMSPEQVMGRVIDGRSDIFSLGGILHELVALRPTWEGTDIIAIMRAVLDVDAGPAMERVQRLWPELLPVFQRCLALAAEDRYPDTATLRSDLDALAGRIPDGISVATWVGQLAPSLAVARTGELGEVVPAGASVQVDPRGLSDAELGAETLDLDAIAPDPVVSFEMPLGPLAGPSRGVPSPTPAAVKIPTGRPPMRPMGPAARNLASSDGWNPELLVPIAEVRQASRPAARAPVRAPSPSPPRNVEPPARPATPRARPPQAGHRTSWQKAAKRRAVGSRLFGAAFVVIVGLYAATWLPGDLGARATEIWESLRAQLP